MSARFFGLVLAGLALGCVGPRGLPVVPLLESAPAAPRVPRRAEIAFHCSQPDAEVVLDGVPQGTCEDYDGEPRALGLGPGRGGSHQVQVRKPGFSTWESWLSADGTRVEVDVTLVTTNGGRSP